jgi:MFS family permease
MGLGIAEAALGPAAFSLIRDSFSEDKRGRAFATLQASHLVGTGTALAGGGALFGAATAGKFAHIPLLGTMHPWQQVLVILGSIGFPVAALMLTVKEPARTVSIQVKKGSAGFGEALGYVARNKSIFIPFWAGITFFQLAQGGLSGWTAMTVHRTWNIPIPTIGAFMGPLQIAMGLIGAFSFGTAVDVATKRGVKNSPLVIGAAGLSFVAAAAIAQFFVAPLRVAIVLYVVMLFFIAANSTSAAAGLAQLVPTKLAGKLQALTGLAINLLGLAFGSTLVAVVSKTFFHGPNALHDALAIVVGICTVLGISMYLLVLRALARQRAAGTVDPTMGL